MALKNLTIGNTNTELFDGTQGESVAITVMFVTNTSGGAATLTLHAIDYQDANQTPRDTNTILKEVSIDPGDTFTLDTEKLVLGYNPQTDTGDKVVAVSDVDAVLQVTMSYVGL